MALVTNSLFVPWQIEAGGEYVRSIQTIKAHLSSEMS